MKKTLPHRWHTLRPYREQTRLWTENKRFKVVPAGRRSGKTELAKRRLVVALHERKPWKDARYFAGAPTRDQAKRIFWRDLRSLVPKAWVKRVYEGDLCIVTIFGSELWVVGLDRPERIEGVAWDGGVLDEYANMRPEVWTEHIRPALSDRVGWCWFIGVPEGLNHYKELRDYAASGVDEDWGLYSWPSSLILPQKEVEAAKRVLDERTFRQEYEANFEGATGRAYYAFDRMANVDPEIVIDPKTPLLLCCDFNVAISVWPVAQSNGKVVRVVDEVALRNTNTMEMGKAVLARYRTHPAGILVYGDASGAGRSTAGESDYAILSALGLKDQRIRRANPPVKDRLNAVNSMFRNAENEARIFIHPKCALLIKDLESVAWSDGGGGIDKTDAELTHASDALGYYIEYEYPLRRLMPEAGKRYYK